MATRGTAVFKSVEELETRIESYFDGLVYQRVEEASRKRKNVTITTMAMRAPTISGLACDLGVSRRTLLNYSKKDKFSHVLARARNRIAKWHEEALYNRKTYRAARFMLEVNHGYGKLPRRGTDRSQHGRIELVVLHPIGRRDGPVPKWEEDAS
jgi:DNA-packaging protein gp3